jgi:hypothetical protein
MNLVYSGLGAKIFFIILLTTAAASFSKPASAGSFIEIEGRFITILGRTFCWFNCDELKPPPAMVKQPAIIPPKPR